MTTVKQVMALSGLALAIAAGGCTPFRAHQGFIIDPTLAASIQPGIDTRDSVARTMGRPSFVGQFGDSDWYYLSRDTKAVAFANPRPYQQQVLHVTFDAAGNVVKVDKTGMDQIVRLSPNSDKTPTLGRKRNLFTDIFGGIGRPTPGDKKTGGEGD